MRRMKVTYKQPNPLFEKWLQEWKDEAAAKGSDMQHCFAKALSSLKKYPLPLESGRDCGILKNFGNRLCVMLDRKLAEYKKQHREGFPNVNSLAVTRDDSPNEFNGAIIQGQKSTSSIKSKGTSNRKKKRESTSGNRKATEYIPSLRSGSYAILLGLLQSSREQGYQGFTKKDELLKYAQPLCDASFTKPEGGTYYTAWSSMSTLIKKGLVSTKGRGSYSLTSEGESLALRLEKIDVIDESGGLGSKKTDTDIERADSLNSNSKGIGGVSSATISASDKQESVTCEENTILTPWSFDVILLVDTRESSGVSGEKGKCYSPLNDLHKQNVKSEVRHLKVGDFAWICRERSSGKEVILPYIIERKRVDDFARSIIDGRFQEQKYRLKQSGIPNLMYLVENHGKQSHTSLPLETLNQAAANTGVVDGFIVKYTNNHRESANYLAQFTNFLANLVMPKTIICCKKDIPMFSVNDEIVYLMSFQDFNCYSTKNKSLAIQDMFIKHLIQLKGMSVEKAVAIVEKYPTPYSLYKAFQERRDTELLSDITNGSRINRIGPILSKSVHDLFSKSSFL